MGKVIAVINEKGGVGKTTTAIEFASILADRGKKVLLIDFDVSANTSKSLPTNLNTYDIQDVIEANCRIVDAIQKVGKLDMIISTPSLSNLLAKESRELGDYYLFADAISYIKDDYDFIITDNCNTKGLVLSMSFVAADYVIIPTDVDDNSFEGVKKTYDDVRKYATGDRAISNAQIALILLTRYNTRTNLHDLMMEELREAAESINGQPDVEYIRSSIAVSETKRARMALIDYNPRCEAYHDYEYAVDKFLERIGEQ